MSACGQIYILPRGQRISNVCMIAIAVYKVVLFYLSLRHKSSTCVARAVWAVDVGLENALRHCFSLMVDLSLKKYLWLKDLHGIPHNITSPIH